MVWGWHYDDGPGDYTQALLQRTDKADDFRAWHEREATRRSLRLSALPPAAAADLSPRAEAELLKEINPGSDRVEVVRWHLTRNLFPPVPDDMAEPCAIAVALASAGKGDVLVDLPRTARYCKDEDHASHRAPAWEVIRQHSLTPFLAGDESRRDLSDRRWDLQDAIQAWHRADAGEWEVPSPIPPWPEFVTLLLVGRNFLEPSEEDAADAELDLLERWWGPDGWGRGYNDGWWDARTAELMSLPASDDPSPAGPSGPVVEAPPIGQITSSGTRQWPSRVPEVPPRTEPDEWQEELEMLEELLDEYCTVYGYNNFAYARPYRDEVDDLRTEFPYSAEQVEEIRHFLGDGYKHAKGGQEKAWDDPWYWDAGAVAELEALLAHAMLTRGDVGAAQRHADQSLRSGTHRAGWLTQLRELGEGRIAAAEGHRELAFDHFWNVVWLWGNAHHADDDLLLEALCELALLGELPAPRPGPSAWAKLAKLMADNRPEDEYRPGRWYWREFHTPINLIADGYTAWPRIVVHDLTDPESSLPWDVVTGYFCFLGSELEWEGSELAQILRYCNSLGWGAVPENFQEILDTALGLGCSLAPQVAERWWILRLLQSSPPSMAPRDLANQLSHLLHLQTLVDRAESRDEDDGLGGHFKAQEAQAEFGRAFDEVRPHVNLVGLLDLLGSPSRNQPAPRRGAR